MQDKRSLKFTDYIKAAFSLAILDGGFVIAIQIITFLLKYFGMNLQITTDEGVLVGVSKTTMIVSMLGVLNLAAIIYRITGLARGIKYSPAICYQQALRRWPTLILLYILAGLILLLATQPIIHFLNSLNIIASNSALILFGFLLLIPPSIVTCIFIIDQEINPIQAVFAMFKVIRQKIGIRNLSFLVLLYALPFFISTVAIPNKFTSYVGLFNSLWFLFCHITTIVVYASNSIIKPINTENNSKVIVL